MHRHLSALSILVLTAAAPAAQPMLLGEPARDRPAVPSVAAGAFEYLYDDGAGNVNIGPPSTFDPDMLWGNYFFSDPAGPQITEISVSFGPTFPSSTTEPVTFWLLDDPDGDADPRTNASVLRTVDAMPDTLGNNHFFRVAIDPPAEVSAGFFVGASVFLQGGEDRPARVDTDGRADRSWFFYAPDIAAVIDSLAGAPFGTRMDDQTNVPFPGAFMVRALGQPVSATEHAPAGGAGIRVAPNPAVGDARVRISLAEASNVRVDVVDAVGRVVATLLDEWRPAGVHDLEWRTRGISPGLYAIRCAAGDSVWSARIVVVR